MVSSLNACPRFRSPIKFTAIPRFQGKDLVHYQIDSISTSVDDSNVRDLQGEIHFVKNWKASDLLHKASTAVMISIRKIRHLSPKWFVASNVWAITNVPVATRSVSSI